ncbi:MAG: hypothetical protein ACJ73C_13560, partial [Nitrososphaeraceae archaeon]
KSMFMLEIEKYMPSKVYVAEGAATTKAGIHDSSIIKFSINIVNITLEHLLFGYCICIGSAQL